jgi:hypothetical protein
VAGRRVWSDERVQELASHFVAAADEVYRLQRDGDPECLAFRRMVQGHERPSKGSMQGTYVFSPAGDLLGRLNSNDPASIAGLLEDALVKWDALPAARRQATAETNRLPDTRWEHRYPASGLVLRRTARDLPGDGDVSSIPAARFNRDAIWFTQEEARRWLPVRRSVGARRRLPRPFVERLARYSFVDNARGQSIPYDRTEVKGSRLDVEVVSIEDGLLKLSITGRTVAVAEGPWLLGENYWKPQHELAHSIKTKVLGRATFDLHRERFVDFQLAALGERTGRTDNNGRRGDEASGPIGFVVELAPANWRVAPTFINMYGKTWVPDKARFLPDPALAAPKPD